MRTKKKKGDVDSDSQGKFYQHVQATIPESETLVRNPFIFIVDLVISFAPVQNAGQLTAVRPARWTKPSTFLATS